MINKYIKLLIPLLILILIELLLRFTYSIRNSFVNFIPLPYIVGSDYGPIPPWHEKLKILMLAPEVVWKGKPNFKQVYIDTFCPVNRESDRLSLVRNFIPIVPNFLVNNPKWEVSLNSEGYRDDEFLAKSKDLFRIVCLGDSWTFGANVAVEDNYTSQLKRNLNQKYPELDFDILNMGVLGYSSFHGPKIIDRVIELEPDVVIAGFAMNEKNNTETDLKSYIHNEGFTFISAINKSEIYKIIKYFALMVRWTPKGISHDLALYHTSKWKMIMEENIENEYEPWMNTSLNDYERNYRIMIDQLKSEEIDVILLYPEFWINSPYVRILKRLSREYNLQLTDSSKILFNERIKLEDETESNLNLKVRRIYKHYNRNTFNLIFRVYMNNFNDGNGVFITGKLKVLGNLSPNKIRMYDDGTHGDQIPDDKVWSILIKDIDDKDLINNKITYVYTNSGKDGIWEGLDVPYVREIDITYLKRNKINYAPIDIFGTIHLHSDPWHTNAEGNKLIAENIYEKIRKLPSIQRYIDKTAKNRITASQLK